MGAIVKDNQTDKRTYAEMKEAFLDFLTDEFGHTDESLYPWNWTYEVLDNVIDYIYREHGAVKGAGIKIISSLLPEVEEEEIRNYLPEYYEPDAGVKEDGTAEVVPEENMPDQNVPIGKGIIREALDEGVIQIKDDKFDNDVIAVIGNCWLYFAGSEGETMTAQEYVEVVPEEDIVSELYDAIERFRKIHLQNLSPEDEWVYYWIYLSENVHMERIKEKASDWELIDDDYMLYGRCLGDGIYRFIEKVPMNEDGADRYAVATSIVDLNPLSDENIEEEIEHYYSSLEELRALCLESSARIIAEIIFENMVDEEKDGYEPMTNQEAVNEINKITQTRGGNE